MEGINCRAHK